MCSITRAFGIPGLSPFVSNAAAFEGDQRARRRKMIFERPFGMLNLRRKEGELSRAQRPRAQSIITESDSEPLNAGPAKRVEANKKGSRCTRRSPRGGAAFYP